MLFVYLIRSTNNPNRTYVGLTKNVERRLNDHNTSRIHSTRRHKPWELVSVHWFQNPDKAKAFESYLKSGSGRAFANKRLW